MLVSLDWVRDFTPVPNLSNQEIYSRFTLATAEVEDLISVGEHLEKIVIAEILSFEKHPEADKLNLVTFRTNTTGETKRVVCGASNVKVGIKIPYACLGVKLPNGLVLEPKKIRGVLSEGMLCSEEELGFAEESEGIMELPADAPLGVNMLDYFKMKRDLILDIDNKSLTHRPDLWGHYGMAREFSAIFQTELKNPFNADWTKKMESKFTSAASPIKVRLEGESATVAYYGLSLEGVKVGESPEWLKSRLKACGVRSINNIVDISNYVMLELGTPLHFFDRDQIKGGEIILKLITEETKFTTLDEQERTLVKGDTVIADANGPLVLAGIMGGATSSVNENTKNLFIEVANFKAAMVRKTSTRLGLRSDSSQRFEKTLDPKLCYRTLLRALELVLEICPEARVVGKAEYDGIDLNSIKPITIKTSVAKIKKVLGLDMSDERVLSILHALDFQTTGNANALEVVVPSYRATKDVSVEADLVEEIGRIVGYDNISPISPLDTISPVKLTEIQKVQRKIRDFMVIQGKAFEVMSYPLIGESLLNKVAWPERTKLKLINSLSVDHDLMRPSLIPSLLEVCETNTKHYDRFRFFELGRAYKEDAKNFSTEALTFAAIFADKDENTFVDTVNVVSNMLSSLNLPFELVEKNEKFANPLVPSEWIGNHPFEYYNIRVMGKFHGVIMSIHPLVLRKLKIKGNVTVALLDLSLFDKLSPKDKTKYKPLNKFQTSTLDFTFKTKVDALAGDVLAACKKAKVKEVKSIEVLDIFTKEGEKFITVRATLADEEQTLTQEILKNAESSIIEAANKAGYPLK